uniref:Lipoyl synthase n=1 Tax=Lygus hesperus TaxID=30085 RepID=A0A0A9ZAC0_LYGHE
MKSQEYRDMEETVGAVLEKALQKSGGNQPAGSTNCQVADPIAATVYRVTRKLGFIWLYTPPGCRPTVLNPAPPTVILPHEFGLAMLVDGTDDTKSAVFVHTRDGRMCFYILVWPCKDLHANSQLCTAVPSNIVLL